ncbi:hypothetical protein [Gallaecimonas pentaromativorans]|uniref:hypothetical protein n=1 Tax=Gallaecimonas pentaromativorans TaxID=584787 RepID=UPI003A8E0678
MNQNTKIILAVIFLMPLFFLLLAFCGWYLFFENAFINKLLAEKGSLIVIDSTVGYCLSAVLVFLPGLFFVPFSAYFKIKGLEDHKVAQFFNKIMVGVCLVSLASLFFGPLVLTQYWETKAEEAGYTRCSSMTLLINRIHYTAWMQDIYYCDDPSVARILGRGSHHEVEEVNQYIRRQNRE